MPSWLTDKVAMEALLNHFTAKPTLALAYICLTFKFNLKTTSALMTVKQQIA